ncbi:MAG: hypothetical protein JSU98_16330 [Gemmatimonadales bacterium]|jgi:hypothetical protein|nr:MAG: hypothetical protein JSU98_16330 [Gemmatimonadales bacterium]
MQLYKANGEIWNPHYADIRELDHLLRKIVDAIRYRRPTLSDQDAYGQAVTHLTEAAMQYTAIRRREEAAAGSTPLLYPWMH